MSASINLEKNNRSKTQHHFDVTTENYVKGIYNLLQNPERKNSGVRNIDLAKYLGVTRASITGMLRKLEDKELILRIDGKSSFELSPKGFVMANKIIRKHRLIEMFLGRTLDLEGLELHEEAELLEHAISDKLLVAIDEYLDHPTVDDSGLTIPREGSPRQKDFTKSDAQYLTARNAGDRLKIVSIADYSPESVESLKLKNLQVGQILTVLELRSEAFVHIEDAQGTSLILSFDEANLIRVLPID